MRTTAPRLALIDALKAFASQLIVLHHIAFYGPMSDVARDLAPALISWLSQDARIAVQVFLVIGGFLAARTLAPEGRLLTGNPLLTLYQRYFKLVFPYLAALLLAIACASFADRLMDHDSIPGAPHGLQLIAHALLLQNLLGVDALSAGVWYVAIDFQLFALLLGTLWLARRLGTRSNGTRALGVLFVALLAGASLFFFNRDSSWDDWALYFFGSYALGALTYWASTRPHAIGWLGSIAAVVMLALLIDFRSRIAVALLVAIALGIARRMNCLESWPQSRALAYLGQISYSVFLVNFPVALAVNAIFAYFAPDNVLVNGLGVLIAWLACVLAGAAFHRYVECRSRQAQQWAAAIGAFLLRPLLRFHPLQRLLERLALLLRVRS
ncbi:MAG: acyltransferase family protein [Rhodocyclaceae bacterium]